jgi:hypothetical protein
LVGFAKKLDMAVLLGGGSENFLIYTVKGVSAAYRNSGNFTEPGSFASYLCLALSLNLVRNGPIFTKKNYVFIIGILTTLSTAGYLALFFIIIYYVSLYKKGLLRILFVFVLVASSYYCYLELEFLNSKIDFQMHTQLSGRAETGRFKSMLYDLEDLSEHPFSGRGLLKATMFDEIVHWEGDQSYRSITNGLTNWLLRYGIIGFIIYSLMLYSSLNQYCIKNQSHKHKDFMILGVIFLVAFSQQILSNPIFISLLFFKDFGRLKPVLIKRNPIEMGS